MLVSLEQFVDVAAQPNHLRSQTWRPLGPVAGDDVLGCGIEQFQGAVLGVHAAEPAHPGGHIQHRLDLACNNRASGSEGFGLRCGGCPIEGTADGEQSAYRTTELSLDDPAQGGPRQGRNVSGQPAIELAQAEGEVPHSHVPCSSVEHFDHLLPGEVTLDHQALE